MKNPKRVLSAILATVFIFTTCATSVSASKHNNDKGKSQYARKVTFVPYGIAKKFYDLEKFPWAEKAIERMRSKGLIKGKENGIYAPHSSVTKLETIIMALRVMGWENQSTKYVKLPDTYRGKNVSSWATGYVTLAYTKGILDDVDMMYFDPDAPATRHEVAKYVIRALGYEDEAQKHMNDVLDFDDDGAIPQGSVGYVYLANKMGLMVGAGGRFNPMGTLTRAEMAVLFDRLDEKVDTDDDQEEIEGEIRKISDSSITLYVDGASQTYDVSEDVVVYKDNRKMSFSKLAKGDYIMIRIADDEVVYIEVTEQDKKEDDKIITKYAGKVTDIDAKNRKFTITMDTMSVTFVAINDVEIIFNDDDEGIFDEIAVGNLVRVIVDTRNRAREIYVDANRPDSKEEVKDVYSKVSGEIVKLRTNYIIILNDDEEEKYYFDEDFTITIDDKNAKYSDLKIGMKLDMKLKNDLVYQIDADGTEYMVTGKILAITQTEKGYELKVLVNDEEVTYPLDKDVEITVKGEDDESIDSLKINQEGDFYIENDTILNIDIK